MGALLSMAALAAQVGLTGIAGWPVQVDPSRDGRLPCAAHAALIRELAGSDVVLCGHGGLQDALRNAPRWTKGSTFVVGRDLTVLEVREP